MLGLTLFHIIIACSFTCLSLLGFTCLSQFNAFIVYTQIVLLLQIQEDLYYGLLRNEIEVNDQINRNDNDIHGTKSVSDISTRDIVCEAHDMVE